MGHASNPSEHEKTNRPDRADQREYGVNSDDQGDDQHA